MFCFIKLSFLFFFLLVVLFTIQIQAGDDLPPTNCQKCYYEKKCKFSDYPTLTACRTIMTDNGIVLPCCCREGTICDNSYNKTDGYDPTKQCRCKKDLMYNVANANTNTNTNINKYNPSNVPIQQVETTKHKNKNNKSWFFVLCAIAGIAVGIGVFVYLKKRRQQNNNNNNEYERNSSPREQNIPVAKPIGTTANYPGEGAATGAGVYSQPIVAPGYPGPVPASAPVYVQQAPPQQQPIYASGPGPVPAQAQAQGRTGLGAGASALLGGAAGLAGGMLLSNALHSHSSNHQNSGHLNNNDTGEQHVYHHHYNHGEYQESNYQATQQQGGEYTDGIVGTGGGYDGGYDEYEAGEF